MRYGSVCSGIEAATVAWHSLGWQPAFFSEIEPFPRAVLAHHYPEVPLHGDFTTIEGDEYGAIDLLVGGTPCQSFSVAGLRKGMDDNRGQLALQFLLLARRTRARWLVWENVPGVLSSNGGRDFGAFLGGLVELGYGFAYRVLDAQYFGVAQRRRRVFVVGHLGDWQRAAAVLFERHSLSGDTAPRRKTGQDTAGTLASRTTGGGFPGTDEACSGYVQPVAKWPADIASTLNASFGSKLGLEDQHINGGAPLFVPALLSVHGTQDPDCNTDLAHTLGRNQGQENAVCYGIAGNTINRSENTGGNGNGYMAEASYTLTKSDVHGVAYGIPGNWIGRAPENGGNAVEPMLDVAPCQTRTDRHGVAYSVALRGRDGGATAELGDEVQNCLRASQGGGDKAHVLAPVAFAENSRNELRYENGDGQIAGTLSTGGGKAGQGTPSVQIGMAVRRLTPVECERLQGFPDDYTLIPWRNNPADECPGGPRYKALGNSMAVPCMAWIGERIQQVEQA